ncbi:MAG: hypothetical protein EP340_00320 [Alphaproteobacteria bacterium]|nr:MAG: hypothetical protein EP340_00320 [Alphaproteobacteria bacterium]
MDQTNAWIWLTLFAVVSQSARTAAQRQLSRRLDEVLVALARYAFGLPLVAGYFAFLLIREGGGTFSVPGVTFWGFVLLASVAQVVATVLMLRLFHLRNFAVGITYVRSETFLTALLGAILFGEAIAFFGWVAIVMSVMGVIVLNVARQDLGASGWALIWNPAAALGLGAGLLFALTSLSIRTASLSLGQTDFLLSGATTLLFTIIIQIIVMVVWLLWKRRAFLAPLRVEWRACLFIGVFSGLGSIGWFTAFTVQIASYVKALSQIELILAIGVSSLIFKEKIKPMEYLGVGLIAAGVLCLVWI